MSPVLRRYLQLDVFARSPGAGNPLAVVLDAAGMDPASMQAFAAWTNLSETIFLLPPQNAAADYRVRIFTPRQELPFAGHPSVGAAWAAVDGGVLSGTVTALTQECAAGLLPVRIATSDDQRSVYVRAPRATPSPCDSMAIAPYLAAAIRGLSLGAQEPALWSNGPDWWLVELADENAVRTLRPDLAAIAALTVASGAVGLAVYGRTRGVQGDYQLAVRAFCPADNIPEDPVTGSANACIAALLAQAGSLPCSGRRYRASQGREVGRDGIVEVEVDADGDVWIGGEVQRVIAGSVMWPDTMPERP
jgi:PhzF family phenazine biosynthesis protein